jgi:hypothetical protein
VIVVNLLGQKDPKSIPPIVLLITRPALDGVFLWLCWKARNHVAFPKPLPILTYVQEVAIKGHLIFFTLSPFPAATSLARSSSTAFD